MGENSLAYTIALQRYARALMMLLRACSGAKKRDVARVCGVTTPLVSHWLSGLRPIAPVHERPLRRWLTGAIAEKREALAVLSDVELRRLQQSLIQALVDLDSVWIAMAREYEQSVREEASEATARRETIQRREALPRLWAAREKRNRALRPPVEPTADIRGNGHDLLHHAAHTYRLEEHETPEQ